MRMRANKSIAKRRMLVIISTSEVVGDYHAHVESENQKPVPHVSAPMNEAA